MVGNRLTETTQSTVTSYQYDNANRIYNANNIYYVYDNNGNLTYDGAYSYSYDSANRLTQRVNLGGNPVPVFYRYNGLGDRLQEGVYGGATTTFTMDLNSGLTQVLDDGTNTYLYGNGRIAQVNTTSLMTDYYLGDALGSVRQLTSSSGAVTYARAYDPYGVVTATSGASGTPYGYTGEYTTNDLVYLRARHYDPAMGRFLTRDTWDGDANIPMSYNAWAYGYANPINNIDPSGRSPLGQNPCNGQPNYEICYARWIVSNGGELTEDIIKSIYNQYPEETLQLIQRQFDIKLPAGFSFRVTIGGSAFDIGNRYNKTYGVSWWFARYIPVGTIFESSENQCGLFSTDVPEQAIHIDDSVYITKHTFADWKYKPDDLAGIMIHEAVHAWQENVANNYVFIPGLEGDPSSISWFYKYSNGMERQAVDYALEADSTGRIDASASFKVFSFLYKIDKFGGKDFPYELPPNVP